MSTHATRLTSPHRLETAEMRFAALAFSSMPLLLLPYDSVVHLLRLDVGAQTMPLCALFSVPYLLVRGRELRLGIESSKCAVRLLYLALVVFFVTATNIAIESSMPIAANTQLRLAAATRQGIALALGVCTFLMFQDCLLRLGRNQACAAIAIGTLPSLALAFVQVAFGTARVSGFSSEPSHFADFLVFAALPALLMLRANVAIRAVLIILATGALVATFSSTGFFKAGVMLLAVYMLKGQAVRGTLALGVFVGFLFAALALFPDNYAFHILSFIRSQYLETGQLVSGSLIDRVFGLLGPISMLEHPRAWFGLGLGADSVYFNWMFSPEVQSAIRDVKGELVSVSSLQGKMLLYAGVVGYFLYLRIWLKAWKAARRVNAAEFVLPALFVGSCFSLGPIFLPYTWFWLAFATTISGSTGSSPRGWQAA